MKYETAVIPAKAGIQYWREFSFWTPAFAGATTSNILWPDQSGANIEQDKTMFQRLGRCAATDQPPATRRW